MEALQPNQLRDVYRWVDQVPLSRPKRNIARDFSDAVLMAEMIYHFAPALVELHNYSSTNSVSQKIYNWETLNRKVLKPISCPLTKNLIKGAAESKTGYIEHVLFRARKALEKRIGMQFDEQGEDQQPQEDYEQIDHYRQESPPPLKMPSIQVKKNSGKKQRKSRNTQARSPATAQKKQPLAHVVVDLQETVEMLQLKIEKLEQLLDLKNQKIDTLTQKLSSVKGGGRY
jgi:hypothetical protein